MRVNKNLLIQKTNEELENYLKPNKGYVVEAIEYAVEILKERGYVFSEEQQAYILEILLPAEEKIVHKDYIIASNLIFASAALGGVSFLIGSATIPDFSIFGGLFSLLIIAGVGVLARAGTDWLKYVLLVLLVIGLATMPFMILLYTIQPWFGLINFCQTILQIIAVVYLFKAPPQKMKMKDIFETTAK